jgi:hypothetical protein
MNKKHFSIYLFISLSIFITQFSIATVRFVSKTGSSTPPYTSWATASDSIQKCINICQNGDTVYVANGVYEENLIINTQISLIGLSMDSTIIDGSQIPTPPNNFLVRFNVNINMKLFTIIGNVQNEFMNGVVTISGASLTMDSCVITNFYQGLALGNSSSLVTNCTIKYCTTAIRDECPNDNCFGVYSSNTIISNNSSDPSVNFSFGGTPTFTNNIVIEEGQTWTGVQLSTVRGAIIKNNLIYGFERRGIRLGDIRTDTASTFNNNIRHINDARDPQEGAIVTGTGHRSKIVNNIITNTNLGISGYHSNDSTKGDYNLFWNVSNLTGGNTRLGDSNIVADPMFVKDTIPTSNMNYNFHLQRYSPAIDKGDPSILDKNGSRSDIGMYGGPLGETYKYLDLPPKTPRNFSYSFDTTHTLLTLRWDMNYESDFSNYNIYRDTVAGFTPSILNLISQPDTSFITENISEFTSSKICYRVTAEDSQGNESEPSEEIAITITDINVPHVEIIRDYILYQNYPNPFNPSTAIGYSLKERSYVKLMVYDIKGELISVLVNKEQEAGYYEVEFNTQVLSSEYRVGRQLASGIYLYRIEVIGEGNIPVYSDIKKMILLR